MGLTAEAFLRDVAPELRVVQIRGSHRYARRAINRWLEEHDRRPAVGPDVPLASASDLPSTPRRVVDAKGRVLLTAADAADLLGISRDVFREDVAPSLRGVDVDRTRRYLQEELEAWLLGPAGG